jgi:hypothetical protein
MSREPLPETFHHASQGIAEFARRWREGKATLQEIESADIQLLGLRRLIADHKNEKAHAANVG